MTGTGSATGIAPRPARPGPAEAATALLLRGRRRARYGIGALLLLVTSAGGFVVLQRQLVHGASVLLVVHDVDAGQVLTADDLLQVQVVTGPQVGVIPASRAAQVVGRPVALPLTAGSLLSDADLGPSTWPGQGRAVVAVPVADGRLADGVVPGSAVLVVPVEPATGTTGATTGSGQTGTTSGGGSGSRQAVGWGPVTGSVVSVRADAAGSGTDASVVSLDVASADAITLAQAGGDVSIVLAPG